jgi:phospholipid/cholesterol/gamma-HCH transport system permease protein
MNPETMIDLFEHIGSAGLRMFRSLRGTLSFAFMIFLMIFDRRAYNSAVRTVLLVQLYFTSIQLLPLFFAVSVIFGSLLIGIEFAILRDLGLMDYAGRAIMGFTVTEVSPFMTVILIALRSGSAVNTEIAVMKVSNELHTLERFHIDTPHYLFLPRIINGIVSVCLLTGLFAIVVLASGLLYWKAMFGMSFDAYMNVLLNSVEFPDIIILLLKSATFGFFTVLIPIMSGLNATHELTSVPIAVLQGMVRIFIAIVIIEVLSLIIRFI